MTERRASARRTSVVGRLRDVVLTGILTGALSATCTITAVKIDLDWVKKTVDKHDERITTLEHQRWRKGE